MNSYLIEYRVVGEERIRRIVVSGVNRFTAEVSLSDMIGAEFVIESCELVYDASTNTELVDDWDALMASVDLPGW